MKKSKKVLVCGVLASGATLLAYGVHHKEKVGKVAEKVKHLPEFMKDKFSSKEELLESYVTKDNYTGIVFSVLQGVYRGDGTDFSEMTPSIEQNLDFCINIVKNLTIEEIGGSYTHHLFWVKTQTGKTYEFIFELNTEGKVCSIRPRGESVCQE